MDAENHGSKPYEQMDDLGGFHPPFKETAIYVFSYLLNCLNLSNPKAVNRPVRGGWIWRLTSYTP